MASPSISPSRLGILGYALGGTAIQVTATLGPLAPLMGSWVAPISVLAGALAGLGFNRIAAGLDKKKEFQEATRELLTNRDIALAQARAIEARLKRYVRELGNRSMANEKRRLSAIAEDAEIWWSAIIYDPFRNELATVRDDQIVARLASYLSGQDHLILDVDTWVALLTEADQQTKGEPKLGTEMTAYFAGHLAGNFAQDFVEVLKTDLQTGGKAYAAISLRFFGEILTGVRDLAHSQAGLKPLLGQLPTLLKEAHKAIAALRASGLPTNLEETLRGTQQRLEEALESLRQQMHERFDALPDRVASELERRRLVRPKFEFKADISHFNVLKYAPTELVGRESELNLLTNVWQQTVAGEQKHHNVLVFVAFGGEGKTSLVAKWAADLAHRGWSNCDAVFAWSFYSQGTREQTAASSDLFLKDALTFFGDASMADSAQSAFYKGRRLAQLIGERRTLLILDGLEPLQYAPTSSTPGDFKDEGIAALIVGLAAANRGLCIVTTRYSLSGLKAFWPTTVREVKLLRLSRDAGAHLLKTLGVNGAPKEFETLVEEVKGHALTLALLAGFLHRAFRGDIRQRDCVSFEKADEKIDGGHAFRTMATYEQWLLSGGDEGNREVAVLRLVGLFDRPAEAGCLAALRSEIIPGLTEPLADLADADWEFCVTGLETAKLLVVNRDTTGVLVSLEAHPHLREYFAKRLREKNFDAWRAAHRLLYEHLYTTTPDKPHPALEDLQPLYQAMAHGCQAGLQQEAFDKVYIARILRGTHFYSSRKLGAIGSDLSAIAYFFDRPWSRVSLSLNANSQAEVLNAAGFRLRALGRLNEARDPFRASQKICVQQKDWKEAAIRTNNLSELQLTLGDIAGAVRDANQAVIYTDSNSNMDRRNFVRTRSTHADALHQAGRQGEAETRFREAEVLQAELQPAYPLLYGLAGFRYHDLLLAPTERKAWRWTNCRTQHGPHEPSLTKATLQRVSQLVARALKAKEDNDPSLLTIALDHLTLGRVRLYEAILEGGVSCLHPAPHNPARADSSRRGEDNTPYLDAARRELEAAVDGLRRAGQQDELPRALLTRAWLRFFTGPRVGRESARADLDEAWEIAERGPMKLFLTDIHLHRARLFFHETPYPWNQNQDGTLRSPADDLAAARRLIDKHGYLRRKEELEDGEEALNEFDGNVS